MEQSKETKEEEEGAQEENRSHKKPYTKPQLRNFGSVHGMTQADLPPVFGDSGL